MIDGGRDCTDISSMSFAERLRRKNEFDGSLVYGARQFNRTTGRLDHFEECERLRDYFLDPVTGLLKPEMQESRGECEICGGLEVVTLFVKDGFTHVRCVGCGFIFVDPIVKPQFLEEFYKHERAWVNVLLSEMQRSMDEKKFRYGLDLINSFVSTKGRLLDIGCGTGQFLEIARSDGWDVQGVEFNEACVDRLENLRIDTLTNPIEECGLPTDSYRCVTLWEVLEHLPSPRNLLRRIAIVLDSEGLLFVCVPNIDSLVNRILHEKSVAFGGHSHINFFNAQTLGRLMEEEGFRVRDVETIITDFDTVNNYLNFEEPYVGQSGTTIAFLTPELIHQHLLGSKIILVGSKKAKG